MKKKVKSHPQKRKPSAYKLNILQILGIIITSVFFFTFKQPGYYDTLVLKYYPPAVRASAYDNFTPSPYPVKFTNVSPPILTASAAAVIDLTSAVPLFQKNTTTRLRPASITKLMTALVVLDYYKPEDVITVGKLVTISGDSKMGLKLGDQLTVRSLLYGLLLPSGNDAAYVLAENIPGGYTEFINAMNRKASSLHMTHTHFENPSGRDEDNHYTTISDVGILAREVLQNALLSEIVKTSWTQVSDVSSIRRFPLQNVNDLLTTYYGTYGIKTGYTDLAGQCLVAAAERGQRHLLTIVLNSRDRFGESTALLNFGFNNFVLTEQKDLR